MTVVVPPQADEARQIRLRLQALEDERLLLESRLRLLEQARTPPAPSATSRPAVTNSSSAADKVALFRRLFAGRTDVFPTRWDNPKSGRSGYAPACANEWVRGVCGKPQVKCGECPSQAFIPVTGEVIKRPDTEERLVLATGRYLGEGFDDASLDTLFLTMPISWRGTLAQYVGRLHREHHAKREVIVYDYVDSGVAMLARMALKRQTGYRSLGYEISTPSPNTAKVGV